MKKLTAIICLLLCLAVLPLPYPFYQFLKIAVCGFSIFSFYLYYPKQKFSFTNIWLITLAIIYNPISPLYITKEIWIFINILTILTFLLQIFKPKKINKENFLNLYKYLLENAIICLVYLAILALYIIPCLIVIQLFGKSTKFYLSIIPFIFPLFWIFTMVFIAKLINSFNPSKLLSDSKNLLKNLIIPILIILCVIMLSMIYI